MFKIIQYSLLLFVLPSVLPAGVIANFPGEFRTKGGGKKEIFMGWSYLWNPLGVEIGERTKYVSLLPAGSGRMVPYQGKLESPYGRSAHLAIRKTGSICAGNGVESSVDKLAHYAIVAYSIQPGEAGSISVVESRLQRQGEDGPIDFRIYVNDVLVGTDVLLGTELNSFNVELGDLKVGDTVYFAIGGDGKKSGLVDMAFRLQVAK